MFAWQVWIKEKSPSVPQICSALSFRSRLCLVRIFSHGYGQLHFSMIVSWLPKENWIRSKKKRECDLRDNDFYTALVTTCFQTEPWMHRGWACIHFSTGYASAQGEEYISLFSVRSVQKPRSPFLSGFTGLGRRNRRLYQRKGAHWCWKDWASESECGLPLTIYKKTQNKWSIANW